MLLKANPHLSIVDLTLCLSLLSPSDSSGSTVNMARLDALGEGREMPSVGLSQAAGLGFLPDYLWPSNPRGAIREEM